MSHPLLRPHKSQRWVMGTPILGGAPSGTAWERTGSQALGATKGRGPGVGDQAGPSWVTALGVRRRPGLRDQLPLQGPARMTPEPATRVGRDPKPPPRREAAAGRSEVAKKDTCGGDVTGRGVGARGGRAWDWRGGIRTSARWLYKAHTPALQPGRRKATAQASSVPR